MQVSDLLNKLRKKLTSFVVLNRQGQMLGRIEDFTIDKDHQLNMVIFQPEVQASGTGFLLSSKCIQEVDPGKRSLVVDISKAELERLPVYESLPENGMTEPANSAITPSTTSETNSSSDQSSATEQLKETLDQNFNELDDMPKVLDEEIIRLLEERLVVNRSKKKVGEVVVRKEIETRMIEVPVQREKLIVEQVGAGETQQLAEIDLGESTVTGVVEQSAHSSSNPDTVTGEFLSPRAASDILAAIALQGQHGCSKIRVELVVENQELQESYQKMLDRCSKS